MSPSACNALVRGRSDPRTKSLRQLYPHTVVSENFPAQEEGLTRTIFASPPCSPPIPSRSQHPSQALRRGGTRLPAYCCGGGGAPWSSCPPPFIPPRRHPMCCCSCASSASYFGC